MFGLQLPELLLIAIALVILFFGGKKLTEFARGLGRFTGEFQKGRAEMKRELDEMTKSVTDTESNSPKKKG